MIIVIGDYIVDQYIYGSYDRISPESPIPVFKQYNTETRDGGAGNVVNNLKALGNEVTFFRNEEVNSIKTRYVVDNHIVFRADNETYYSPDEINMEIPEGVKYAILSDYNKGFLEESKAIIEALRKQKIIVIVDPKKHISNYENAHIVKFNRKEFREYTGLYSLEECEKIHEEYNIHTIIVTMGGEGVFVSDRVSGIFEIRTDEHKVSDVTGAGDIFIAALTHFLNKESTLLDAVKKANILASSSVTKFGTTVLTEDDICKTKTVFTNGCFDILHKGHVEYLKKSKELGAKLIVGLNSDKSVKKLKGNDRPINNEQDRKAVLEALDCVDEVFIFDEDTPYKLIKSIRPDIITKGGDYTPEEVIGNDLTTVVIIPLVDGYSTTKVVKKTRKKK
jgi:D-beta-D-heptose 7-phosphate kinase/D-beta-D-heptose 1-phosphate adenosyltransferase